MTYDLGNIDVVIVDDNELMQRIIAGTLRAMGAAKIRRFDDPAAALTALRADPPDLVIVDYVMAGMDGRAFVRAVRAEADPELCYVPIIVLTAHTEKWRVVAARDAGATEILAKPVAAKTLYRAIAEIVERPRSFIRSRQYFGPDRRRRERDFAGDDRRTAGGAAAAPDTGTEATPAGRAAIEDER